MTIQELRCAILARADEVVKDPDDATIRDVAILISAILILLVTRKRASLTANHRLRGRK
jgi:hypothetical protein